MYSKSANLTFRYGFSDIFLGEAVNLDVGWLFSLISCLVFGETEFYKFKFLAEELSFSVSWVRGVGDCKRALSLREPVLWDRGLITCFTVGERNSSTVGVYLCCFTGVSNLAVGGVLSFCSLVLASFCSGYFSPCAASAASITNGSTGICVGALI